MNIHFTEYPDIRTGKTIIGASTIVGGRKIYSRMYVSDDCRQGCIDAAYHMLKDEVISRALNEMRVQQIYDNSIGGAIVATNYAARWNIYANYIYSENKGTRKIQDKVDWKKEGF